MAEHYYFMLVFMAHPLESNVATVEIFAWSRPLHRRPSGKFSEKPTCWFFCLYTRRDVIAHADEWFGAIGE